MPFPEGPWYEPTWIARPPGMETTDFSVWRVWLAEKGGQWNRYTYDIELWEGAAPATEADPAMRRMWARAVAKRIDAIGERGGMYTIFETRRGAGWQSIGQLIGYRRLFKSNYPGLILEDVWLLTDRIDPAIAATAQEEGIVVWTPAQPALEESAEA